MSPPLFIQFEERLKTVMRDAEKQSGVSFSVMRNLVRAEGGINAVKRLLERPQNFSTGFKTLHNRGLLNLTVESVVLEFENTQLFTAFEFTAAKWRLENAHLAEDEKKE
jgi:hypothetical protein